MNESTAIVATYMSLSHGELVVFFKGASAESAFATWLKVVGSERLVKVEANP
jgi:hypothetical protein